MVSPTWVGDERQPDPTALRGFKVPPNGCFGAATLQCLCRLKYFDNIDHDNQNDVISVFARTCKAINSLDNIDKPVSMETLWTSLRKSVRTNSQLRPMFNGQQMDAEELLRYMMDLLSVDVRTRHFRPFESITEHYKACVHATCPHLLSRRYGPREYDSAMVLKLPILRENERDVGQVKYIGTMMQEEFEIEHNKNMTCEVCKNGIDADDNELAPVNVAPRKNPKGMYVMRRITSWPDYLIILVLRYDKHNQKLNTTMKLEPYVVFETAPDITYELVSFVDHMGSSPHSGHYTAYCKINQKWVLFDDANAYTQHDLDEVSSCNTLMFYKAMPIRFSDSD